MSKYVIDSSTLTDIADAIRDKTGSTDSILVSALAQAITDIPSGGSSVVAEIGTFSFASASTEPIYCEHSLGIVPQYIFMWNNSLFRDDDIISGMLWDGCTDCWLIKSTSKTTRVYSSTLFLENVTDEGFDLNSSTGSNWNPTTYTWLAIGGIE